MDQKTAWDDFYKRNPRAWRGFSEIPRVPGEKVLELGCGNGKTVQSLLGMGYRVAGVDFSETAINYCRDRFPEADFLVSDITELPFPGGYFDYVTAVHVLENLGEPELEKATGEISRVLSDGGYLFVRCFTPEDMRSGSSRNGFYYRYYTEAKLVALFPGYEVISSSTVSDKTRFGTVRSRAECLFKKLRIGTTDGAAVQSPGHLPEHGA